LQEAFDTCQIVAAICRKLLTLVKSLLQSAATFWQLPFPCRNLQRPFGSCHFLAAICSDLLAVAISLPQFAATFWQLPFLCRNLQQVFGSFSLSRHAETPASSSFSAAIWFYTEDAPVLVPVDTVFFTVVDTDYCTGVETEFSSTAGK
jgi:hypothetical protein